MLAPALAEIIAQGEAEGVFDAGDARPPPKRCCGSATAAGRW